MKEFTASDCVAISANDAKRFVETLTDVGSAQWGGLDVVLQVLDESESEVNRDISFIASLADGTHAGTLRAIESAAGGTGRNRWWLRCSTCGSKRIKLFQRPIGFSEAWQSALSDHSQPLFNWQCSKCIGLCYESEVADPLEKYLSRKAEVERELGLTAGWHGGQPIRPTGMHKRRYTDLLLQLRRLREEYNDLLRAALGTSNRNPHHSEHT